MSAEGNHTRCQNDFGVKLRFSGSFGVRMKIVPHDRINPQSQPLSRRAGLEIRYVADKMLKIGKRAQKVDTQEIVWDQHTSKRVFSKTSHDGFNGPKRG